MIKIKETVIIIICFFILGCGPLTIQNYRHYKGEQLPKNEVAIIKGYDSYRDGKGANSLLRIRSIDHKEIVSNGALKVFLLPGEYKIGVFYVFAKGMVDYHNTEVLDIKVKKGKTYILKAKLDLKQKKVIYHYDEVVTPLSDIKKLDNRKVLKKVV